MNRAHDGFGGRGGGYTLVFVCTKYVGVRVCVVLLPAGCMQRLITS
jgi:hypothetical protein